MKTKLLIIALIVLLGNVKAQNQMTYVNVIYNDSVVYDTNTINITYIKDNNLLNASSANYLIQYANYPMIINEATNKRALHAVFATVAGWGVTPVNNLYLGNYAATGLNENLINFFDLYYSNNIEKRKELLVRMRHELNGSMASMLDSVCVGYGTNGINVGTLLIYDESREFAILEGKYDNLTEVNIHTVTLANEEEIDSYY